jgi:hypothetical protein
LWTVQAIEAAKMMRFKLSSATKWLSWLCVVFTLLFVIGGFGASLGWFGRGIGNLLVWCSVFAIFAVAALLIACLILERGRD